jgi:uncharacterized protein (TIGR00255 family)
MKTYSMTGFGRASTTINKRAYTLEVRTLNSKQLDLILKIPSFLKELEMDFRSLASDRLIRGKIEINLAYEALESDGSVSINTQIIRDYIKKLNDLENELPNYSGSDWLNALIRLPDVLVTRKKEVDQEEKEALISLCKTVFDETMDFRLREGTETASDITKQLHHIKNGLQQVKELAPERLDLIRNRISKSIDEIKSRVSVNEDRFEQELIYYLEKLDVNEEFSRLESHLDYFHAVLQSDGEKGKKLGFISQEIGREINTIGSKSNHATMQKEVVGMKDSLEKIKEQLLNIL